MAPSVYRETELRIQKALASVDPTKKANLKKLAREYDVPYNRLMNRAKGRNSRSDRPASNRKLTDAQELALCHYLDGLARMGLCIRLSMVAGCANSILAEDHTGTPPPPQLGENWVGRFLIRHPEHSICKARTPAVDKDSPVVHQPRDIANWYQRLGKVIKDHNIRPGDIYNFGGIRFRAGVGRRQWVITRDPSEVPFSGHSSTREGFTLLEAICGDGTAIPPMLIIAAQKHLQSWYDFLKCHYRVAVSDSGHTNDQLAYEWLVHFDQFTSARAGSSSSSYRLLLFNGHFPHCTCEFLSFCKDKNIIPFCIPAHTTHLLQPLDVILNALINNNNSDDPQALNQMTSSGEGELTSSRFVDQLKYLHDPLFTSESIEEGFREAGINPLDSEMAVQRQLLREPSPAAESDHSDASSRISTEETIRQLENHSNKQSSLSLEKRLDLLLRGSLAVAHLAEQVKKDIKQLEEGCRSRHTLCQRTVEQNGILHDGDSDEVARKRRRRD